MTENEEVQSSIQHTKSYVLALKETVKYLKEISPKDRLETVSELIRALNALMISVGGWKSWLGNLEVMNAMTEEELKTLYPKFKGVVIDFLNVDIETTERMIAGAEAKVAERKDKKKTAQIGKYVS